MTHWLIVGGGTAGCVLANRLSEDERHHVTLVEAGPAEVGTPAVSYLDDLATAGALWPRLTVSDGDQATRYYPQGRGLGGSSAVNGTVLSGEDLPQYAAWGWDDVTEANDRVLIPRQTPTRDELGPVDRALLASANDAGPAMLSRQAGVRVSTATAYLGPSRRRPNLDVVTDTLVDRIAIDGRRAIGVVTAESVRIDADRVVCAAGAIHTPAVLLRSGVDDVGVGESLMDHPSRIVEVTLRPDQSADPASLVTGAALRRSGIEIVAMNHLGRERPGSAALFVGLLRTSRRGSVRLDPARREDPAASPLVDFGRLDDPRDVQRLADGVEVARNLLSGPAFTEVIDGFEIGTGHGGYAHASSSCPMGTVVDQLGAVVGYEGLFVADASVFPEIPAAGTYLPVVLLAERLARRWLATAG